MKVLIVDDDIFSIKGLEKGVNWAADGIDEIRQAASVDEAKSVLKQERVDIMICDIEMPGETGIDLIEWIREEDIPGIVIFYSCHADFIYAQTAMKLKVFDYILKPSPYSDIDKVLVRAVEEQKIRLEKKRKEKYGSKKERALKEKLMRAILDGTIPDTEEAVLKMQEMLGIEWPEDLEIRFILHDLKYWEEILETWSRIDIEFSFMNMIREIFCTEKISDILILPMFEKYYLTILEGGKTGITTDEVFGGCRRFNQAFKRLTGYGLNSFVGKACRLYDMERQLLDLYDVSCREQSLEGVVASEQEKNGKEEEFWVPYIDVCYKELLTGNQRQLEAGVEKLLETMEAGQYFSYHDMYNVSRAYVQAAGAVLEIKNIDKMALISSQSYREVERRAAWGPGSLKKQILYINKTVSEVLEKSGNERNVIEEIKSYIIRNLDHDISREELAEVVFLNEDYMSRLFRKQEGISLTQYMTDRKIERAKELLECPDISVTAAAEGIGMTNFPYFSKIFKRAMGISPSEYKRRCQKSKSD